jgi:DNA-binding SARP family transcriptional activator
VRINILGPIEVTGSAGPVRLAGQRQRALLAALVLEHERVVPMARLVDVLWDNDPPATAWSRVQVHICALRQAFGQRLPTDTGPIVTRAPGYQLRLRSGELDLADFGALVTRAGEASRARQTAAAAELLDSALGLWRGEPCADVASPLIRAAADALHERRLLAIEAKAEADLTLGRYEIAAAELARHVTSYPLRERLRALLMLAWYRMGCRADALHVYREGRRVLVTELGLEPGPQLRRLHQRILSEDHALYADVPSRAAQLPGRGAAVRAPAVAGRDPRPAAPKIQGGFRVPDEVPRAHGGMAVIGHEGSAWPPCGRRRDRRWPLKRSPRAVALEPAV